MLSAEQNTCIDQAYKILETVTPLRWDCGRLCGSICCTTDAPGKGMILLPGEEKRYDPAPDWAEISSLDNMETDIFNRYRGYGLHLLNCHGSCPREQRPLACRMFPLAPILTSSGVIRLVLDRDGIEICPLVQDGRRNALNRSFVRKVRTACQILVTDPLIRVWIEAESLRRLEEKGEPWINLISTGK